MTEIMQTKQFSESMRFGRLIQPTSWLERVLSKKVIVLEILVTLLLVLVF